MNVLTAPAARANFERLMDQVADSHEPIIIEAKRGRVVLLAEADWNALQETLALLNSPGMQQSIKAGMREPLGSGARTLDW
jgi:prevent-host-death family protein